MRVGDRYGSLTVVEVLPAAAVGRRPGGAWARVRCECGRRWTLRVKALRRYGGPSACACRPLRRVPWLVAQAHSAERTIRAEGALRPERRP